MTIFTYNANLLDIKSGNTKGCLTVYADFIEKDGQPEVRFRSGSILKSISFQVNGREYSAFMNRYGAESQSVFIEIPTTNPFMINNLRVYDETQGTGLNYFA